MAFTGAPHNPGTRYAAKAKDGMITIVRIILRVVDMPRICHSKYIPIPAKHAIQMAMKSQRGNIPHPYARSATLRNLSANASSRKARTTLKEVIQLPERGAFLIHCGNIAKSEKGNAKAIAKPNIPTAGANKLCPAASTNSVPMIGPVQEKETITSVNAMSSMLRNPPVERALLSNAVDHESGRVISKSPKKESAKIIKMRKKMIFTTAFVLRSLSAEAPKIALMSNPSPT